ncbi:MAG TPA: hypothetical protein VFP74_14645, partial [Pseudolabrys sp.]|nr:hypothetical protein [Pseudolabrys sp.]
MTPSIWLAKAAGFGANCARSARLVWGGTGGFPARNSEIQVASANSAGLQQERQEETEMGRDEGTKPAMPP